LIFGSSVAIDLFMKSLLLAFFTMGLGCAVSGCSEPLGCTEIGCSDSTRVSLTGIAEKYAGSLPLTIKLCVDGSSCITAELTKENGALTCRVASGTSHGGCAIQANGKDLDIEVALDSNAAAKAEVKLSVLVTDGTSAKLFEADKSVTVASTMPNGEGCEPTCHQAEASFTP
jgi:hypothetical protein